MNAVRTPELIGDGKPAPGKRHVKKQLAIPDNSVVDIQPANALKDLPPEKR
jgi:hypothetical protein